MQRGGKRTGAGRPKGKRDAKTEARAMLAEEAAAQGITPLEVMLQTMRRAWDTAEQLEGSSGQSAAVSEQVMAYRSQAMNAAKDAAPYIHPKLAPIDGKTGEVAKFVIIDPCQ